jgi:hypothetical protein
MRIAMCLLALAAVVVTPATAQAYRTYADDPEVRYPARWYSDQQTWELSRMNLDAAGLSEEEALAAARAAFATLRPTVCENAFPENQILGMSDGAPSLGDGRNTIAFVTDWSARALGPSRGATTDLQLRVRDDGHAEIVEADIYLNLEEFEFDLNAAGTSLDLQAVLTHEGAHSLGGLHVCEHGEVAGVPSCESTASFRESVLYPDYLGESARLLASDDVSLLCDLYPPSSRPCTESCAAGFECRAGACVSTVPPSCSSDSDCSDGVCAAYGEDVGRCVTAGVTGARCMTGNDCASRVCLTESAIGTPYCTTRCATAAECAPGDRCAVVEGTSVCAPPPRATCSIGQRNSPRPGLPTLLPLVLAAFGLRRRR